MTITTTTPPATPRLSLLARHCPRRVGVGGFYTHGGMT